MNYIVKNQELIIQYYPGKGAWTYHLKIPNTEKIKGKWGSIKVSGLIDDYPIEAKNLMPIKDSDKLLSINGTIRKSIDKDAGDTVHVTLYLISENKTQDTSQILECFKDADVIKNFDDLSTDEKHKILKDILAQPTEDQQVDKILEVIQRLK